MHRLRARTDRVQKVASAAIGRDRELAYPRHARPADHKPSPINLSDAQYPECANLETRRRAGQDCDRFLELFQQKLTRRLTDAEQVELDELDRCVSPLDKAIIAFRVGRGQL
jgi:hypothetical protein